MYKEMTKKILILQINFNLQTTWEVIFASIVDLSPISYCEIWKPEH